MMDKKPMYTPGPWQVLPEEMGKNYLRVRGTMPGLRYKIANVCHPEYHGVPESEAEVTRAIARLIAAAPDLREALQGMVESYEHEASPLNPALLRAKQMLRQTA